MTPQKTLAHDAWSPFHPRELAQRLAGVSRPWCIVGGWALDLWHGHETREHEDIEFTVLRGDVSLFRQALSDLEFYATGSGMVDYLPDGQEPPADIFQIWCQDPAAQRWRVDMMIEPGTPDMWVYKRDPGVTRPRAEMVAVTPDGLPYLKPAAILLFKAKLARDKDVADFANAVPKLEIAERAWLKAMLERAHPGHEWIGRL
ncbi:amino acid transporter [Devosia neptuniae]|uniref:Amino acid transporter n=1 Tax=Devosia neptuniae TaxID=191302 RepID=A0ABY6CGQ7_9HYPH|nr:amino acid transporter [Devosia neptuniae]UXN71424.1 amino acid transporter [Devosia neptuniae]